MAGETTGILTVKNSHGMDGDYVKRSAYRDAMARIERLEALVKELLPLATDRVVYTKRALANTPSWMLPAREQAKTAADAAEALWGRINEALGNA